MSSVENILKTINSKLRERSVSGSRKSVASARESKLLEIKNDHKNNLLMVNPDCYIQLIIDYIYEKINLDTNIKFDLCDENGFLLGIDQLKPQESGLKLLNNRQTYVVTIYEKDENDMIKSIEPLIYKTNKQEADFFVKFVKNLSLFIGKSSSNLKKGGLKSSGSLSSKKSKSASKTSHKNRRNSTSRGSKKSAKSD